MPLSALFLYAACVFVFLCFVSGTLVAARRAGRDAQKYALGAVVIFFVPLAALVHFAHAGAFANFARVPPPFMFLFFGMLGTAGAIALSPLGTLLATQLSWSVLVGFQAFRILAELVIHFGYVEGLAPVQLSFHGYNFDIVPAVLAGVLFFYLRKNPNVVLVKAWNALGLLTLMIIAFIAITSMPTPMRVFMEEPSNAWVTALPYTLLPGVLVTAALAGHLLIIRKITLRAHRAR